MAISACRLLVNAKGVRGTILGARYRGISVIPTSVSLTTTRLSLVRVSGHRDRLGVTLTNIHRGCSCVFVSYPPSLKLVAVGTLGTDSAILIPVRYRCFTLRKLSRLVTAMHRIGELCGPALRVRKVILAVCSTQLGLANRIMDRVGGCFTSGLCGATVPHTIELSRTPSCKVPVRCCSGHSGNTTTCGSLTGRFLGGGGEIWVVTIGGNNLNHKLSDLFGRGSARRNNVLAVGVGSVRPGSTRPHGSFSRSTISRLTSDVTRRKLVRPVIIAPLSGNECDVITNREH